MLLPATGRRVLAVVLGALLSVLVLVKVLDIGFFTAFNRPFSPVDDLSYVGIGIETCATRSAPHARTSPWPPRSC